jgi:aldehyde dehydrogenase
LTGRCKSERYDDHTREKEPDSSPLHGAAFRAIACEPYDRRTRRFFARRAYTSDDVTSVNSTTASAGIFIDGVARADGTFAPVVNPARTSQHVGRVALGSLADVDAAVAAAERAGRAWADLGATGRAALLLAAADALDIDAESRATLLTREHGKVLWESQRDVRGAIAILRYYAGLAERFERPTVIEDARGKIIEARRPIGVTAIIVPWNFPQILCLLMLAPSLVAGNTVVIKPPSFVPLALSAMLERLARMLPPGVVNVVPGSGAVVGMGLAQHPRVRKVSFTGSTEVGRELIRACSQTVKVMSMELGGNDPALVLESATINERLINELVAATFTSSGQICYAAKRIYVHRSHFDAFVDAFSTAVDRMVVGDGLDPESSIGPVNNRAQYESVQGLLDRARADGANVRTLGKRGASAAWDEGYFLQPAVITRCAPRSEIVAAEQFGPLIPILPFDTEDEAVALANDSEFGLAASVWTDDIEHGFAIAARIEAGTAFVNTHKLGASDVTMPFGGFKQSGLGRGHGFVALEEASELQTLVHRIDM